MTGCRGGSGAKGYVVQACCRYGSSLGPAWWETARFVGYDSSRFGVKATHRLNNGSWALSWPFGASCREFRLPVVSSTRCLKHRAGCPTGDRKRQRLDASAVRGSSSGNTRGVDSPRRLARVDGQAHRRRSSPKLAAANTSATQTGPSRRESTGPALRAYIDSMMPAWRLQEP